MIKCPDATGGFVAVFTPARNVPSPFPMQTRPALIFPNPIPFQIIGWLDLHLILFYLALNVATLEAQEIRSVLMVDFPPLLTSTLTGVVPHP